MSTPRIQAQTLTHTIYESALTGPLYAATVATDTSAGTGPAYTEGTAARNTAARSEAEAAAKDFMMVKLFVKLKVRVFWWLGRDRGKEKHRGHYRIATLTLFIVPQFS